MILVIEPTTDEARPLVTVTMPGDDLSLDRVVELFGRALLAYGFREEVVRARLFAQREDSVPLQGYN